MSKLDSRMLIIVMMLVAFGFGHWTRMIFNKHPVIQSKELITPREVYRIIDNKVDTLYEYQAVVK